MARDAFVVGYSDPILVADANSIRRIEGTVLPDTRVTPHARLRRILVLNSHSKCNTIRREKYHMAKDSNSIGTVVVIIIIVGMILSFVYSNEPPTLYDAQQNLELAQQRCKDWQEELNDHPEYFKTDLIANTEKKTKHLGTVP